MVNEHSNGTTKVCPSCGARCYSDTQRCYECLYEFDVGMGDASSCDSSGNELVAVGVVVVKKESAPDGALEITMRFDDTYTSRLAKSFSACSCTSVSTSR